MLHLGGNMVKEAGLIKWLQKEIFNMPKIKYANVYHQQVSIGVLIKILKKLEVLED